MRLIGKALPGPRRATLPAPIEGTGRVLFIERGRIGDMILATPVIRAIAEALPAKQIDILATPTTAPVLENNPHVGRVLTVDRRSFASYLRVMRQLRRAKYEVMVDGRIRDPAILTSTPLLMFAGGATYRIGAGGGQNATIYNVWVGENDPNTHYIDGSKALAAPFGVDTAKVDWQPEIFLTGAERERAAEIWRAATPVIAEGAAPKKRLLVNLSASESKGRWPDGKFIATLRTTRAGDPGIPMIVIGAPSEWKSVELVSGAVGARPVATPDVRDAFALVGTSDIVFTPDTSISHAASAFRKPSLVLLKREHRPYAPYNTPGEIVAWNEDEIQQLPYERVSAALAGLIARFG